MQTVVLTIHIILAICITIFVLLQRSEGGALGSLGGGQSAASLFTGRQAGNFLSRMTVYLFIGFIITSLTLVIMAKKADMPETVSILPTEQSAPISQPIDNASQSAPISQPIDNASQSAPISQPAELPQSQQ